MLRVIEMFSAMASLLYNVMFLEVLGLLSPTLPKLSDVGDKVAGKTPVPVNAAVWGLFEAVSVTFRVAVRVPAAPGVKVTEIVHWDFAARLPPQAFVGAAKSLGLAPVNVMVPIIKAVERLLVSVTFVAPLVVCTACAANLQEVGPTVACTMPVPVNEAVCGLFEAVSVTLRVPLSGPRALGVNVTVMVQ